jgi:hypothetical protein
MASDVVGIDHREPGVKQRATDATALGIRMDAKSLQVPDRFLRKRPLQSSAGSCEPRERAWGGKGDPQ